MSRPSSVSVTWPPRPVSSVARAASRSVSWPRMWARPRSRDGRVGERAQRGDRRGQLADLVQVEVDAVQGRRPGDGQPVVVERDGRAHQREHLAQRVAGLVVVARPVAHRHRAPGDRRRGEEGRGVGQVGLDGHVDRADRPGPTRQRSGRSRRPSTPCSRSSRHRHVEVGEGRHRRADVAYVDPCVVPGAGEQQRGDELASRRRRRSSPRRRGPPGAADGEGQAPRPSSSTRRRGHRSASRTWPHRPGARVRVAVERDRVRRPARRPGGRSASPCRRGRSRQSVGPVSRPGVTVQSAPVGVDDGAQRGQGGGHQLGVARAQRAAHDGRAVGQGGEDQRPVGQRLRARAAPRWRRTGPSGQGAGQGSSSAVIAPEDTASARRHSPAGVRPRSRARPRPRAWRARQGPAGPRCHRRR